MSEKVFSANEALPERTSAAYQAVFRTPLRVTIPGSAITSVRMTLTAMPSGTVINGRNNVETLTNGTGSVASNGQYTLMLDPDDTAMDGTSVMQQRRLNLNVTYTDGEIPHVVTFFVKNQPGVP